MENDDPERDPAHGFESQLLRNFSAVLGLFLGVRECSLYTLLGLALLALLFTLLFPLKGGI